MKKFLRHSRKGSALLIGLIVTIFISIFITSFLEKALRIGQGVKSVEQSVQAYYAATSIIEEKLGQNENLRKKPWNTREQTKQNIFTDFIQSSLTVLTGSSLNNENSIPLKGQGNSSFSYGKEWNLISLDKPVQLVFNKEAFNRDSTKILLKIPNLNNQQGGSSSRNSTFNMDISRTATGGLIYFSVGDSRKTFYLNNSQIFGNEMNRGDIENSDTSVETGRGVFFATKDGTTYDMTNFRPVTINFSNFLDDLNCGNGGDEFNCTIKFSMLNPVFVSGLRDSIPFLEYRIENLTSAIPLQFMDMNANGYVGKIIRQRKVKIPQITTNTALDFAVLQ